MLPTLAQVLLPGLASDSVIVNSKRRDRRDRLLPERRDGGVAVVPLALGVEHRRTDRVLEHGVLGVDRQPLGQVALGHRRVGPLARAARRVVVVGGEPGDGVGGDHGGIVRPRTGTRSSSVSTRTCRSGCDTTGVGGVLAVTPTTTRSKRCRSREPEFEEFARARTPALVRSAWLLCGDAHLAEDLVQETLAKVYVRWHAPFRSPIENPVAYAQTALTRTFLSSRRRRSSTERPYADLPDAPSSTGPARRRLRIVLLDRARRARAGRPRRAGAALPRGPQRRGDRRARMGVSSGAVRNR